jgi:hypothetical protein
MIHVPAMFRTGVKKYGGFTPITPGLRGGAGGGNREGGSGEGDGGGNGEGREGVMEEVNGGRGGRKEMEEKKEV